MSRLWKDHNGNSVQIIEPDKPNIQNVSVSGSSAPTANPVPKACGLAMLISTTNCWFNWGVAPSAAKDTTSIYLPAGVYFYLPVTGGADKVAFLQDSAAGTAQVIPAL